MLFKILLIVYKALHGLAPKYICDLLTRKQDCCYSLRSDMRGLLEVPYTRGKTSGGRAFVRAVYIIRCNTMLSLRPTKSRLKGKCNFNTSKVEHRCDNGNYSRLFCRYDVCSDPKYRCSEKTTSTTEFWFGAVKANYGNELDA
jgi:hypothetical protein